MLANDLRKIVETVNGIRESRRRAAEHLRKGAEGLGVFDVLEQGLRLESGSTPALGRIAAVDGGIVGQEFHGVDLFLVRACGVCFDYGPTGVLSYEYCPSALPQYSVFVESSLQSHEFSWYNNLLRLEAELSCAVDSAKKFSPSVMLLDGSILPQVGDRPSRDSTVYPKYEEVLGKFKELYSLSQEKGFLLAGVIKDSRGRHFLDLLLSGARRELLPYAHALEKANDTVFLYDFLSTGERTPAFKYSSATSENLVLRDLGEWSKKIASFYLKPAEYDRPIRIDFLLPQDAEQISGVAAMLNSLCSGNREYAYPAVLIEADLRAAMDPSELEFVSSALFAGAGATPDLMALRRNSRPFR